MTAPGRPTEEIIADLRATLPHWELAVEAADRLEELQEGLRTLDAMLGED